MENTPLESTSPLEQLVQLVSPSPRETTAKAVIEALGEVFGLTEEDIAKAYPELPSHEGIVMIRIEDGELEIFCIEKRDIAPTEQGLFPNGLFTVSAHRFDIDGNGQLSENGIRLGVEVHPLRAKTNWQSSSCSLCGYSACEGLE